MVTAPPAPDASPRWGMPDALGWFVAGIFAQVVLASAAVALLYGGETPSPQPVVLLFIVQIGLWLAYGLGPIISTRLNGNGPVADLGASIQASDLGVGLAVGVFLQVVVLQLVYWPINQLIDSDPGESARNLIDTVNGPLDVVLISVIVAIMAPLVEELFYRGLLFGALRRHFPDLVALVIQGVLFGAAHFQGIQLPGLIVVGITFGYLRLRYGRLGPCWAAHLGFNSVTLISLLVEVYRN